MIEREFLIHKSYTLTEVYRFKGLLKEANEILKKADTDNQRITNVDLIHLEIIQGMVKEVPEKGDLRENFFFDAKRIQEKIDDLLGRKSC